MTADVQRELAEALGGYGVGRSTAPRLSAHLLPTVQRLIAAAEKRAAAAAARDAARAVSGNMRMLSALLVRQIRGDRAAALDPAGAASGETT